MNSYSSGDCFYDKSYLAFVVRKMRSNEAVSSRHRIVPVRSRKGIRLHTEAPSCRDTISCLFERLLKALQQSRSEL